MSAFCSLDAGIPDCALTWIDRDGSAFSVADETTSSQPNWPFIGFVADYVFNEMGMVRIRRHRGDAEISWDIDCVSPEALGRCKDLLRGSTGTPLHIVLQFFKSGWVTERPRSRDEALAQIDAIQAFAGVRLAHTASFLTRELAEGRSGNSCVAQALEAADSPFRHDPRLDDHALRYFKDKEGIFRFRHIGEKTPYYLLAGRKKAEEAVAQALPFALDPEFEIKAATNFTDIVKNGRPVYQHCAAVMRLNNGRRWVTYERALVPDSDGILCFVNVRDDLASRLLPIAHQSQSSDRFLQLAPA